MPNKNIRRGPAAGGAPSDFTNRPNANDIYVDGSSGNLVLGTGTSGTSSKTVSTGVDATVPITASTALTPASHAGRVVVINAAAGLTVTLPAATGSGAKYICIIGTLVTSNSVIFQVANGNDYMRGFAYHSGAAGASTTFSTANTATLATESDTMTWNRTTTGVGAIGDFVCFDDFAPNIWSVEAGDNITGTAATPFSAAV